MMMSSSSAFTKRKRMVIDSRSRNLGAYPSPAKYEVTLEEDLFDVTAVNLIVADVPFSAYLIGSSRRSVPFSFVPPWGGGVAKSATALLTVGDYVNPADLATELGSAMTAAAYQAWPPPSSTSPLTFTATYTARTDSFAVQSSAAPFTLLFSGRAVDTPAKALGFGTGPSCDYASSSFEVVAPFRRDFRSDRYVVLKLSPNAEVITSVTQAIDRTFAVVPANSGALNVNTDEEGFEKRWMPPLSRVGRLMIQFTDGDGNPYDFQNQDHRLELMFELVGQPFLPPMI